MWHKESTESASLPKLPGTTEFGISENGQGIVMNHLVQFNLLKTSDQVTLQV